MGDYNRALHQRNALDFSDLSLLTWKMLRDIPEALTVIRDKYRHILVDEYQDTNVAQNEIVRLLSEPRIGNDNSNPSRNRSLFVAGDENQSIYR